MVLTTSVSNPGYVVYIIYALAEQLAPELKAMDSKQSARCVYIGVPFALIVVVWMLCSLPTVFYVLAQFKVSGNNVWFVLWPHRYGVNIFMP